MGLKFTENKNRSSGLSVTTNPRTAFSAHGLGEATQAQAEGGTITGKYTSPLRVFQAIAAYLLTSPTIASPTLSGTTNLTGGQITFPATQSASSNANTLDDYEEGTWTPVITFGGGSTGITYSTQSGYYTKIGRMVHFSMLIVLTSKGSSTGTALVTGLPFTDGTTTASVNFFANNMAAAATTSLMGFVTGSTIDLRRFTTGTATAMADTDFANNTSMRISGVYQV